MKNITKLLILTALLIGVITGSAYAEPSELLKGIFDTMTAADSGYGQLKATYEEYYPDTKFEETLSDDSFTIAVSGNEYIDGSWTFVQDGDYLTISTAADDFYGAMFATYVLNAVGKYYDMPGSLLTGYIHGLTANEMENKYFITTTDEKTGTIDIRIYIAEAYDMKELDEMVLNKAVLDFEALNEDYLSNVSNAGKFLMVANGSVADVSILIGEYGGLDDLAYQSIINVVTVLQPKGWEEFTANYTELADAEAPGYSVTLFPDETVVNEMIWDKPENYSYVLIHFGG